MKNSDNALLVEAYQKIQEVVMGSEFDPNPETNNNPYAQERLAKERAAQENPNQMKFYVAVERKPEHYVGDISITIKARPSEQWKVDLLLDSLQTLEGYEFEVAKNI